MKNVYKSRLLSIAVVVVILLSLAACGGTDGGGAGDDGVDDGIIYFGGGPNKPLPNLTSAITEGELTLTGLEAYEKSWVCATRDKFVSPVLINRWDIAAVEDAYNYDEPMYYDDIKIKRAGVIALGNVIGGKVVLKVFNRTSSSDFMNYDRTETVKLDVRIYSKNNSDLEKVQGTVTVNFVNGVGEGVFIPN